MYRDVVQNSVEILFGKSIIGGNEVFTIATQVCISLCMQISLIFYVLVRFSYPLLDQNSTGELQKRTRFQAPGQVGRWHVLLHLQNRNNSYFQVLISIWMHIQSIFSGKLQRVPFQIWVWVGSRCAFRGVHSQ